MMRAKASHAFETLAQTLTGLSDRLSDQAFAVLVLIGLVIRLAGSFLYGTQDMEWWKAWGTYSVSHGLTSVYGAEDREIIELWKAGRSRAEILAATQSKIHFKAHDYAREEYLPVQPPLYFYSVHLSTLLYRFISPELANDRRFNFVLNLQPNAASALLAWLVGWCVAAGAGRNLGRLAGLCYWLNPVALLNSPIQGFQDPACALLAALSLVMLHRRRLALGWFFFVLGFMVKPQGVLILPVVAWCGILEHPPAAVLKAGAIAVLAGVLAASPFLVSHHGLSMVQGVLSITRSSGTLSGQAMNLWWPVQYVANAIWNFDGQGGGIAVGLAGHWPGWADSVTIAHFTMKTHVHPNWIGLGLLASFTCLNLWRLKQLLSNWRQAIFLAGGLQVYAYFLFRPGAQINHYFPMIPMLLLVAMLDRVVLKYYLAILMVFLVQDLIFYGFGRDFNPGVRLLNETYCAWLTILVAVANVALFASLCRYYFTEAGCKTETPVEIPNQQSA